MSSRVSKSNQSPADYLKTKFHPKLMEGKKNYRKALETLRDTYSLHNKQTQVEHITKCLEQLDNHVDAFGKDFYEEFAKLIFDSLRQRRKLSTDSKFEPQRSDGLTTDGNISTEYSLRSSISGRRTSTGSSMNETDMSDLTYEKACSRASPFDRDIRHPVRPNPNSAMDEIMEVSESDSFNSVYLTARSSYNSSQ